MVPSPPRRISLSSWAVHGWLGYALEDSPAHQGSTRPDCSSLLQLPAAAKARGIATLEVCHFHLPRHDPALLSRFRQQAKTAGVQLFSLLIDDGDLSHPEHHRRDRDWIEEWMTLGAELGFERVRLIAGKQEPTLETLSRACENLRYLASQGARLGLRVTTENWHNLTSGPKPLLWLLEKLEGSLGLCLDFGNWKGPNRHDHLSQIAPLAESCHAKCEFNEGDTPNLEEFKTFLEMMHTAGFAGPFTLVQGQRSGEWESLVVQQATVESYVGRGQ